MGALGRMKPWELNSSGDLKDRALILGLKSYVFLSLQFPLRKVPELPRHGL